MFESSVGCFAVGRTLSSFLEHAGVGGSVCARVLVASTDQLEVACLELKVQKRPG